MNHLPSLPCGPSVHGFLDLPAIKASHIHLYVEECLNLSWFSLYASAMQNHPNGKENLDFTKWPQNQVVN